MFTGRDYKIIPNINLPTKSYCSIDFKSFEGCSIMKSLVISNNFLTTLPDGVFDGLASLETLDLSNNLLMSFNKNVFNGLNKLKLLKMGGNPIISYDLAFVQGLCIANQLTSCQVDTSA